MPITYTNFNTPTLTGCSTNDYIVYDAGSSTVWVPAQWDSTVINSNSTITVTGQDLTTDWNNWVTYQWHIVANNQWTNWNVNEVWLEEHLQFAPPLEAQAPDYPAWARYEVNGTDEVTSTEDRNAAIAKARELLLSQLTDRQRLEYEAHRYFEVRTERALYRIRQGRSANIDVIPHDGSERGLAPHRLCIHPVELVPDEDTMLAQKLMLETNEPELLRIANRHPARAA